MSHASPVMRNVAKRLIAFEENGNKSAEVKMTDAFRVLEKLRPKLATLMGIGGYRALLSRALTLASVEMSWLRTLSVRPDGTLKGLEELPGPLQRNQFFEVRAALVAQLLELLVAFIGENLTLRLVREIWPHAPLED